LPQAGSLLKWVGFIIVALLCVSGGFVSRAGRAGSDAAGRDDSQWADGRGTRRIIATFAAVYVAFILFSVSFVDANTPLDMRILSPLHVALVVLGTVWIEGWARAVITLMRGFQWSGAGAIATAVFVIVFAARAGSW